MADVDDVSYEGEAHRACAELRFAEGLRRRWEEARAESAVQEAVLLSWMEGARGSLAELREATMIDEPWSVGRWVEGAGSGTYPSDRWTPPESSDPGMALMLGVWNAGWQIESALAPLNAASDTRPPRTSVPRPVPAILAGINRDVCSVMVSSGFLSTEQVAIPTKPQVIQQVLRLVSQSRSASAISRASQILSLLLVEQPFEFGNTPTAYLFVKWFLATSGVEPTGVAVLSLHSSQNQADLGNLVQGNRGGQAGWYRFLCDSLVAGCHAGHQIARSVQAGVTVENLGS